jgi:effector-binding domain-containing protein
MAYEVEIWDVEAQPVLAVRSDRVASSEIALFMAESFQKIGRYAAAHGLTPSGKPMARYHNIEGDWFDLEALIPFTAPGAGEADVYASSLRAGRAATCEHVGPYEELGRAYAAIGEWLERQGLRSAGGSWEEYLSDPGDVPPAENHTRIYIPIAASLANS